LDEPTPKGEREMLVEESSDFQAMAVMGLLSEIGLPPNVASGEMLERLKETLEGWEQRSRAGTPQSDRCGRVGRLTRRPTSSEAFHSTSFSRFGSFTFPFNSESSPSFFTFLIINTFSYLLSPLSDRSQHLKSFENHSTLLFANPHIFPTARLFPLDAFDLAPKDSHWVWMCFFISFMFSI
jgi:hypothetical protein